jgi:V/A-type H+-transporting ATPase subunit E
MTTKLQDLTDKIYQEGVQKAREEAETIIKEAREKAAGIDEAARKKAEQTIAEAEKKAEEIKRHVEAEMKMALDQSVAALKQNLSGLITMEAIQPAMKELFADKKYLGALVVRVIDGWIKKESLDLALILPEADRSEMENVFKNQLAHHLNKGLQLSFSSDVKAGFKVGPADGSYVISFTEQDFINFFKAYLRPKTNQLLFESEAK